MCNCSDSNLSLSYRDFQVFTRSSFECETITVSRTKKKKKSDLAVGAEMTVSHSAVVTLELVPAERSMISLCQP